MTRLVPALGAFLLALGPGGGSSAAPPSSPAAPQREAAPAPEHRLPIGNLGSITCNPRRYAFNPAWTLLAAPQDNGSVRLFDVATGAPLPPLEGGWKVGTFTYTYSAGGPPPAHFGFSSDGGQIVWSWGKKVAIWNVASRQVLVRKEVPGSSWGFDFSLFGGEGFQEKVAPAWPAPPDTGAGNRAEAGRPATSPDGRTLAYTWRRGFGLFDVASSRPVGPKVEVKDLGAMEFSPDSRLLATVGWIPFKGRKRNFEVYIWSVEALRSATAP